MLAVALQSVVVAQTSCSQIYLLLEPGINRLTEMAGVLLSPKPEFIQKQTFEGAQADRQKVAI